MGRESDRLLMAVARVLLNDHLSFDVSSLSECNKEEDLILMYECKDYFTHVKHHKKKIAFNLSCMRHFARELEVSGYRVRYLQLKDPENKGSLVANIAQDIKEYNLSEIIVTHPSEYFVLQDIKSLQDLIKLSILEDNRFFCSIEAFKEYASNRKTLRMEYFYRELRKKHRVLMDGSQPVGGKWNYDSHNRKPPQSGLRPPQPTKFLPDDITKEVIDLVEKNFPDHFGDIHPFHVAVSKKQALKVLEDFIHLRLACFGNYQDAMLEDEPWMYHSHISHYLNVGLLSAKEVIDRVEHEFKLRKVPINSAEGFIRQVLGWREYVRGIYWLKMPGYEQSNHFNADNALPEFFWDAETEMNCLKQCIKETKQNAYAHHIQRLMVLGNFLLLAGVSPKEVNEWYWIVYLDAHQWVELPNVSGMILYADGGLLASKPYAASGAYINRMSNYCKNCKFDPKDKTSEKACPFNYLYWNFLDLHQSELSKNPRMRFMYNNLNNLDNDIRDKIKKKSSEFITKFCE